MKDLFSTQSEDYARFRPAYPPTLFEYIYDHIDCFDMAWDCGTGNGQSARELAKRFTKVHATDISEQQLLQASAANNIAYAKEAAERTSLPAQSVDLITVAQALHWFNLPAFYEEVNRVAKKDAIIAAWTYNLLTVNKEVDALIKNFYFKTLEGYWDAERKYVDMGYDNLPFPYVELETPQFYIEATWTLTQLEGYINTWSGLRNFIKINKSNPLEEVIENLKKGWRADERRIIKFPLHLKIAKVSRLQQA